MSRQGEGIVLVGYRATGKSTVGRIIAERLARPFVDLDREIENRAGRSIRSIFLEDGEPTFRQLEARIIADLADRSDGPVVATGGGAILLEASRKILRDFGFVVWLTAEAGTLTRRLQESEPAIHARPALTSLGTLGEVAAVLEARTPLYREVAHVSISTDLATAELVAEAVVEAWTLHRQSTRSGAL
jgi:shikimate kinase